MLTCGGAMSGYCSTDSARIEPSPVSMMTIAITQAKTGRSMKMREIIQDQPCGPPPRLP